MKRNWIESENISAVIRRKKRLVTYIINVASDLGLIAESNMTKKKTKRNKWKTLSSKYVYKHPWIKLRLDKVETPKGFRGILHVVEMKDFVVAIPKIGNKLYLVKQYRPCVKSDSWEFPMGACEKGESMIKAASRELEEEAGLKTKKIKEIGYLWLGCGHESQGFHVYLADDCDKGKQKLHGFEVGMKVKGFKISEIHKMIKSGKIKDSPTVATFHLYLSNRK